MKSMHFASICTGNRRRASLLNLRIVYGQITSADAAWSQLQVWRDLNQDGISQSNELSTLAGLNITRIGLNGSSTGPQAGQTVNNNRVALSTTFTRSGVTRTVGAIAQRAQLDSLITEWAQTSSYWSSLEATLGGTVTVNPPAGMTAAEYRNMVAVLEAFNGIYTSTPLWARHSALACFYASNDEFIEKAA